MSKRSAVTSASLFTRDGRKIPVEPDLRRSLADAFPRRAVPLPGLRAVFGILDATAKEHGDIARAIVRHVAHRTRRRTGDVRVPPRAPVPQPRLATHSIRRHSAKEHDGAA